MGQCASLCSGQQASTNLDKTTSNTTRTTNQAPQREIYRPTQKPTVQKTPAEKAYGITAFDIRRSLNVRPEFDEAKIQSLFAKYKDDGEESILEDGMEKLCQDLGVNPTEFIVLVLAWKFNAFKMCRFTKKEFEDGCKLLKVDSVRSLRQKLDDLAKSVRKNNDDFRDLYRFTFGFGLDVDEGQRVLPSNMAVPLWKLVFGDKAPDFMDKWYDFLEEKSIRAIPRDTWNMFLHMSETIKSDFSNYDESEAWPSLFDDFVETQRKLVTSNGNAGNFTE